MVNIKKILGLMAITVVLNACGEFSYKRGANVAQLEKSRQACQTKGSEDAVEKCMKDNGWTIQKLDSFEIFSEAELKMDEKNEVLATENSSETSIENAQKMTTSQPNVADKPQTVLKTKAKPSTNSTSSTALGNPLQTHVVSSWWKIGAKPDAFKSDSNMCVEKLGEAHKPVGQTQTVTVGFISCMNGKGWKALKKLH